MERRIFISLSAVGTAGLMTNPSALSSRDEPKPAIRLGGPLFEKYNTPDEWAYQVKKHNYTAAYCPLATGTDSSMVEQYRKAALANNIIIAEVGAWSNPLSPDESVALKAINHCIDSLGLAEAIGARCCVNISGSCNPRQWAGPDPQNLTAETFDRVVEITRKIIDAVKPGRTFYTLETMPWAFPDSVESYLKLIKAIDRKGFAVHLDPVNLVSNFRIAWNNGTMIKEAFKVLGPWIKSCHAKDVTVREDTALPVLEEIRPGLGLLDYRVFLGELVRLDNIPLMIEHLATAGEYESAATHIRQTGKSLSLDF